jgi:hypothetical protein
MAVGELNFEKSQTTATKTTNPCSPANQLEAPANIRALKSFAFLPVSNPQNP